MTVVFFFVRQYMPSTADGQILEELWTYEKILWMILFQQAKHVKVERLESS